SNDFSVLNTFTGSTPSSLIRISYDIINLQFDISTDFVEFSNTSDTPNPYYKQSISGYTQLLTDATFITNSDNGDMLEILISGTTSKILFQSEIRDKNAGGNYIELNEYVNDTFFPITGTTDTSITIINLNKISSNNWERSLKQINNHYFNHFCYFSESGGTMTVSPREPYRNKYLFDVNVNLDASNYSFGYNNLYSYYTLEEHLGSIYTGFTDMHDQSSISGFTVTQEYLEQDITYPATISTQDSPLRITPTDPNDLNNFFKYTIVEADGYQTIVLDKTQTYMIIAKPKQAGASSFTPTDISTLYDIGDISNILEDIHYNQPLTWYDPFDREMISNIYRSYSEILCINTDVINRTTGTICEMPNGEFNLRLFNIRNRHNTLINSNNGITNDNNLHLKPVEILDIGIDKITKFPVPIRERDIVIVDNVQISGHTVDIITTWGINSPNGFPVTLVNGLTNEILKIKYGWIFNAKIDKAIIGEDDYGLVWYTGIWYCGEWYDGTWYNGTWYDGIWRNGRWYSWDINKRDLLISHELVKKDENKTYSKFLNGTWINGIWYNGTFGDDITITGYTSKSFMGHTDILPKLNVATWKNGKFYKGEFKNSIWENGVFLYGDMNGGYWKNGVFYDGTFDGNWWNGNFFGGIFKYGIWENGILDNVSKNVKTKFGYNTTTNTGITTEWWDGSFRNSELYSGQITPIYNKKTQWYKGDFINSKWYGGHFHTGTFDKSSFYNGVFGTEIPILTGYTTYMKDSKFLNGLWLDGIFKNSIFENGIWLDGIFVSGDLKAKNPGYSKNVIEIKSIGTLASQSSSS
ncbi:MAG: hypothetical protein KDH96_09135, partial [Candidatus Riesia sp.]|nr:hypothetical protein [Candidatus Riesia sp.]